MKPVTGCLAVLLALAGPCLSVRAADGERPFRLNIAPGKSGEVCMPLQQGHTLAWQFRVSIAATFNVHQHVGTQVLMPLQRDVAEADAGEYTVDRDNDWCLMWKAPAAQALAVEGSWSERRPASAPR